MAQNKDDLREQFAIRVITTLLKGNTSWDFEYYYPEPHAMDTMIWQVLNHMDEMFHVIPHPIPEDFEFAVKTGEIIVKKYVQKLSYLPPSLQETIKVSYTEEEGFDDFLERFTKENPDWVIRYNSSLDYIVMSSYLKKDEIH